MKKIPNHNSHFTDTNIHNTYSILDCACNLFGSWKPDGSVCTPNKPCPCNSNGMCKCGIGFTGDKCESCQSGYFDLDHDDTDDSAICIGKYIKCLIKFSLGK